MKLFRMTDEELTELQEASKPVPAMWTSGGNPLFEEPYTKAMRVWDKVAARVGCIRSTISPGNTGDNHDFLAEESEGRKE